MLKENLSVIKKQQINYIQVDNQTKRYSPWIGDLVNYFYDGIMVKSVFPRKFNADIQLHYHILERELKKIHGKKVLELATGSGTAVYFLDHENEYVGIDISPGLLKKACKRFKDYRFDHAQFFLSSAEELPFKNKIFDIVLCHLSFNFFQNLKRVIQESNRVSKDEAVFYGSVPVPERKSKSAIIRGKLYSEEELKKLFEEIGWKFLSLPNRNGALLYFKAEKLNQDLSEKMIKREKE